MIDVTDLCMGKRPNMMRMELYDIGDSNSSRINDETLLLEPDEKGNTLHSNHSINFNATKQYIIVIKLFNSLGIFNHTCLFYICSELAYTYNILYS